MPTLTLPRTHGCLVCGRDNPIGLHLRLSVDDATGIVTALATPSAHHIGFTDVIHGGLIATVADEAMVWAATWRGGRFCYCGELTIRFRQAARPGVPIRFEAEVASARGRLITTSVRCLDANDGTELSTGVGRYIQVSEDDNARVLQTFVDEEDSRTAVERFARGAK